MKKFKILTVAFVSLFMLAACNNNESSADIKTESVVDTTKFLANLEALQSRIKNSQGIPNEKDLKEAVTSYQDYAVIFPNDPKSPDYMLQASDFAHTLGNYKKSVYILDNIIEQYPNYSKMESVKYNRASHLDFEIRDTTRAKEAYQDFINTYPNSPLVADCQSRIKNIKYSLEELTEKFLKDLENQESAATN